MENHRINSNETWLSFLDSLHIYLPCNQLSLVYATGSKIASCFVDMAITAINLESIR
jgi:hypothetical protein